MDNEARGEPAADGERFHLTLVPPSPITDQVGLDLRVGWRNASASDREYDVEIRIEPVGAKPEGDAAQSVSICRITVRVAGGSTAAVRRRHPMSGLAGKWRVIARTTSDGESLEDTRPLEVIDSANRSTALIGGAWMGFYHWSETEGRLWNDEIRHMTDEDWREAVRAMDEIGMRVIVVQEVFRNQVYVDQHSIEEDGFEGLAFYPSDLYPGRMPIAAKDPVEAVLSEADERDMQVFMGVGLYAWFDFSPGSLAWHKAVAAEVWKRYGHHRSFYGWYVSEEVEGGLASGARDAEAMERRHREIVDFFRGFRAHVQDLAPGRPVMLATNSHCVRFGEAVYPRLLEHLDILCPFGFHRMPEGDYTGEEAAEILQKFCDAAGSHLWMDLEVFIFDPTGALAPRPMEGLRDDLLRFPGFEKILCYQFPGLMNAPWASRKPGGPDTVRLYEQYKEYVARRSESAGLPEQSGKGEATS